MGQTAEAALEQPKEAAALVAAEESPRQRWLLIRPARAIISVARRLDAPTQRRAPVRATCVRRKSL